MFGKKPFFLLISFILMVSVGAGTVYAMPVISWQFAPQTADVYVGSEITISDWNEDQYQPAVAYNWKHHEYLVVWENQGDDGIEIYAQRVSESGELLSWPFYVPDDDTYLQSNRKEPDVAYDPVNDRYLVVWMYEAGTGGDFDIHGRFVPWDGLDQNLKEFTIVDWTSPQWEPKVAYGRTPEEFVVVWMNTPSGVSSYISAQRITAATGAFPDSAKTISSGSERRDDPDIAFDVAQNQYLITWDIDNSGSGTDLDIEGIRLHGGSNNFAGSVISIAGWPNEEWHPRVAACSGMNKYLVVWESKQGTHYDIYARYVNGADGSLAAPIHVTDSTVNEQDPDVACNESGNLFLMAWSQQYSNTSGPYGVSGRFAYSDSSVSDIFAIRPSYTSETSNRWYPWVGGGYSNFLVTWEHERGTYNDIHARLVSPYGIFLPLILK